MESSLFQVCSGLMGQSYVQHALLMADSTGQEAKLRISFEISAHVTSVHTLLDKSNYLVKWKIILSGKQIFPKGGGK